MGKTITSLRLARTKYPRHPRYPRRRGQPGVGPSRRARHASNAAVGLGYSCPALWKRNSLPNRQGATEHRSSRR